ncbi:cytoskeletal protein binding protein [Ceratobasidium sp. 428]|nr:cytoskeletal protein binding protein [Ceratobasidium sp. 428]
MFNYDPVQQWQISTVVNIGSAKPKHVNIQMAYGSATSLQFVVDSQDVSESIIAKIRFSKAVASGSAIPAVDHTPGVSSTKAPKTYTDGTLIRPTNLPNSVALSEGEEYNDDAGGEKATALYDFSAQAPDELSIKQGEVLTVTDRLEGDEWWRCRNTKGEEGVVPFSYLEPESAKAGTRQSEREISEQQWPEKEMVPKPMSKQFSDPWPSPPYESKRSVYTKPRPDKVRTWLNCTGQFIVEAEFLGLKNGNIRLHKTNGVIIKVPIARISPEDVAYALAQASKNPMPTQEDKYEAPLPVTSTQFNSPILPKLQHPTSQSGPKIPQIDWFDFF